MPEPEHKPISRNIDFHYIKSSQFRTVWADGAWGGATPRGVICMALYSERQPIPLRVRYGLKEDDTLGEEVERAGRQGIVREVEANIMMTAATARSLADWLYKRAKSIEDAESAAIESDSEHTA
ncbi:MAG: hypothetical protein R3B68_07880 [Phycisphaerales bacterium]